MSKDTQTPETESAESAESKLIAKLKKHKAERSGL